MDSEPRQEIPAQPRRRRRTHETDSVGPTWKRLIVWIVAIAGLAAGAAGIWALTHPNDLPSAGPQVPEPRLLGTWRSDANATIDDVRKDHPITDAQELEMRRTMFRTTVTYSPTTVTTKLDGAPADTVPYQVLRKEGDTVFVKTWYSPSMSDEELQIQFVAPDLYRVEIKKINLIAYFRRIL